MRVFLFYICLFLTSTLVKAQDCPQLITPVDGASGVPVTTSISWNAVSGVDGYIVSVGTTNQGIEIINNQNVGLSTTLTPPLGLPELTEIFVTITLFYFDAPDEVCTSRRFTTEDVTEIPICTNLTTPTDGAIDVPLNTNIIWEYAPLATGYRLTLGTAPGLGDIQANIDVGNVLFFNPSIDLPPGTLVYVEIDPYNENGSAISCPNQSFTTVALDTPPDCTFLISPMDGEMGVDLSPLIEWAPAPRATGYILNIGSEPTVNNVLDGAIFTETSTFVLKFEANTTYYVRVIPFNDAGQAQKCRQESFSTILGCGPYIDEETGELVDFNPTISLPDEVGICLGLEATRVNAPDVADGYRWYRIVANGELFLLSEESFVDVSEEGNYIYEIYNILIEGETVLECTQSKEFTVVSSQAPTIDDIVIEVFGRSSFLVIIKVSGNGDYEYALEQEGPYTDNPAFTDLVQGTYTVYVRDKNGCGTVEGTFRLLFPPTGFPAYFSPNEDGKNDYWQYVPPAINPIRISWVYVYDRYGKLLAQFGPNSKGWDGTYNNEIMPSEGYWYRAETRIGEVYTGYFSLVR